MEPSESRKILHFVSKLCRYLLQDILLKLIELDWSDELFRLEVELTELRAKLLVACERKDDCRTAKLELRNTLNAIPSKCKVPRELVVGTTNSNSVRKGNNIEEKQYSTSTLTTKRLSDVNPNGYVSLSKLIKHSSVEPKLTAQKANNVYAAKSLGKLENAANSKSDFKATDFLHVQKHAPTQTGAEEEGEFDFSSETSADLSEEDDSGKLELYVSDSPYKNSLVKKNVEKGLNGEDHSNFDCGDVLARLIQGHIESGITIEANSYNAHKQSVLNRGDKHNSIMNMISNSSSQKKNSFKDVSIPIKGKTTVSNDEIDMDDVEMQLAFIKK